MKGHFNTLKMPSFGADMESGLLQQWLIKPGDSIKRGQVVAVIETQKGAIDFEAFKDGIVEQLLVEEGDSVKVGAAIARLSGTGEGEDIAEQSEQADSSVSEVKVRSPATRYPTTVAGEVASPYARRLALENSVDLSQLQGSGPDGIILARDVSNAGAKTQQSSKEAMRSAIAAALGRSKREIPHYYLESTIDVQAAVDWLTKFNSGKTPDQQLLLNAVLHCAVAKALRKVPELNGYFIDGAYQAAEDIHLGTGISIREGGLISPAILKADTLSPAEMMAKLKDLSERVRCGGLRSSEMSSATVTLSSMGERGAEKLFGIIYPPQVALIGIGKPSLRPWVVGSELQPRMLVSVSLAADHRVSDGRQGARFLNQLNKLLQKPETL